MAATLLILVAALVVSPVIVVTTGRRAGWILALVYLVAAATFLPTAFAVWAGDHPALTIPWIPELGVEFALRADGLGVVFTLIALVIGAIVLIYSSGYLASASWGQRMSFHPTMLAFTTAMVALVLTDNLLVLFVAWELTSLASFLLIARSGAGAEGSSMRTLLITFTGGLILLAAVASIWAVTGTSSISAALADPVWQENPTFAGIVAALVGVAAMTKSAQFPFHIWLPDAMAAATPVSAYLHAAAVVKAGIFLLLRFSPAFVGVPAWHALLITAGLLTSLVGGYIAISQDDLKRLMAYSTVSQLGLLVATIGVGTEAALAAAVVHTIAHALFKSGLFMLVGVIDRATGTRDVRRLPALARDMPIMCAVTILGAASMAGVPPMLGFVSKEGLLGAMLETPGPGWAGWGAFIGMAISAVLTFTYTAKIVTAGFFDGTNDREIKPVPWSLTVPAALPIIAGLPLALAVGVLDAPVAWAAAAALPAGTVPHVHLALWHGVNPELIATIVIIAIGVVTIWRRAWLRPRIERRQPPVDGTVAINELHRHMARLGHLVTRMANSDGPARPLAFIAASLVIVVGLGAGYAWRHMPPLQPGVSQPLDALFLVLITAAVLLVCSSDSRLGATVGLSTIGVVGTAQIFSLGAPDVGLTQLLVETLTVIVIMLVLQKLPLTFGRPGKNRRPLALTVAIGAGVAAGVATHVFNGRRDPSDASQYFLGSGAEQAGGTNVTNLILVEFRALDTFGELAVLGMTAVSMIAILSTVRHRHLDPSPRQDRSFVPTPEIPLREPGTLAHRAITQAWGNAMHIQMLLRATTPIIAVLSAWLFWRGHNHPGGGFVAALVGSCIVAMAYLATARDRQIGPPKLPLRLITAGVVVAITTGMVGLVVEGSFLKPIHVHVGDLHLTTSLIFDVGVYLAVLGLMFTTFNLLGTSATTAKQRGEQTRERADEAVEGELPGPMDTSRGERPIQFGPRTSILVQGREFKR